MASPPVPHSLRFSWKALLVAPWPAAVVAGGLLTSGPAFSWGPFLTLTAIILAFAYAGTVALALCVALFGRIRPVGSLLCTLLGLGLALAGYVPLLWISWAGSGPDSGPPEDPFPLYMLRNLDDPVGGLFIAGGAITALCYALIARRQPAKPA